MNDEELESPEIHPVVKQPFKVKGKIPFQSPRYRRERDRERNRAGSDQPLTGSADNRKRRILVRILFKPGHKFLAPNRATPKIATTMNMGYKRRKRK